jgi:hypothetical protein
MSNSVRLGGDDDEDADGAMSAAATAEDEKRTDWDGCGEMPREGRRSNGGAGKAREWGRVDVRLPACVDQPRKLREAAKPASREGQNGPQVRGKGRRSEEARLGKVTWVVESRGRVRTQSETRPWFRSDRLPPPPAAHDAPRSRELPIKAEEGISSRPLCALPQLSDYFAAPAHRQLAGSADSSRGRRRLSPDRPPWCMTPTRARAHL